MSQRCRTSITIFSFSFLHSSSPIVLRSDDALNDYSNQGYIEIEDSRIVESPQIKIRNRDHVVLSPCSPTGKRI